MTQGKRVPEKLSTYDFEYDGTSEIRDLASILSHSIPTPTAREIVRRYNTHDKLVAALKMIKLQIECWATEGYQGSAWHEKLEDALREAGEA